MNKSLSQTHLSTRNFDHNLQKKYVYINQECRKKTQKNSMQTIFHSPFKDGRRNKQFLNPTFMTSDILSNRQFSPNSINTPKRAIIHTKAQNRQKALYNQRMNHSQSFTNISQRVKEQSKSLKKKVQQRAQQGKNTKAIINSTLHTQLQGLLKFRQQRELKQFNRDPSERFFRKGTNKEKQLPVYLEKVYKNPNYFEQQQDKKRNQLQEWLGLSKQLQQIKQQIKRQKQRAQTNNMKANIQNYQVEVQQKEFINRKNTQLLNRILLEQIKAKQRQSIIQKKERGWRNS